MKCSQAQDLMYLHRPGELVGKRRQELDAHLASCPTCTAEAKAVQEMEERVSALRNKEPRLEDAAHLTGAIMRTIPDSRRRSPTFSGALFEWTATPAFRIAACAVLFMMNGAFFLQTAIDARKVATLEGRLKSGSTIPGTIGPQDIQRAGMLLSGTDRITGFPDSRGITAADIKQWQNEPAFTAILQTLFGRQARNGTTMIDFLAKKHPRLASIRIDDGLDDREREILASDGEAFIKDIEALLQKGDVHHDR